MCYASQEKATAKTDGGIMENKKMIVNVYQKHNNGKKALVNVWEDETTNILQLTAFLYRKTIQKCRDLKISYKYNYSDLQTITIAETFYNYDNSTTTTYFEFINVPTKLGFLDIYKLDEKIKGDK